MEGYNRPKVSLRGASVREITRDALLEKAALERSIRNEARRSTSAAQLIQRVWRGYRAVCEVSDKLRFEWDAYVGNKHISSQHSLPNRQLCNHILRPFLYFTQAKRGCIINRNNGDLKRLATCVRMLLQSVNSFDSCYNYCSWSIGTEEEQSIWYCHAQKLINLCCAGLIECSTWATPELAMLASLVANLLVTITDSGLWNCIKDEESKRQAKLVVITLLQWMAKENTDFYRAIRTAIIRNYSSNPDVNNQSMKFNKEKLFVMASVMTVALRPLQTLSIHGGTSQEGRAVIRTDTMVENFCSQIYTIPCISQCVPSAILPALQHPSVLTPCLEILVVLNFDGSHMPAPDKHICEPWQQCIPSSGWTLINVVNLATGGIKDRSVKFVKDLDVKSYVTAVSSLLDKLLQWAEKLNTDQEINTKDNKNIDCLSQNVVHNCCDSAIISGPLIAKDRLINELEPLYQQWHLQQLLDFATETSTGTNLCLDLEHVQSRRIFDLPDIAALYSKLLNLFRFLHRSHIPCPVLNVLAFAPGFLYKLWVWLDDKFGLSQACEMGTLISKECVSSQKDGKLGGGLTTRWSVAISRIKGKASTPEIVELDKGISEYGDDVSTWDIKIFKTGPGELTNEALSILSLFCAAYSHLLMVLDDEEFYERQVPFALKQQRIIAASLNTIVYNGLFSPSRKKFMPLMEVAVKCLNSLYGRDCRRSFCHPSLWLSPAGRSRPPIPAAARAHEVAMASRRNREFSEAPAIGYVLTMIPHVIPFEERVQLFREFAKSDKMARKMAGEIMGPGPGSIEICIRRDHLIEDAFTHLNSLGSRFKSGINVSFVNEHGLAEAGLDYGGLFKEFLTDLAKAAFDPGYGLFSQKETEEGRLFPHPAAANLQHGLPMIEFLGRIVGKAMYEGILLDYSFSHVFIWKLLGHYIFLDELSTLDPKLYQSLIYLKHYEGDVKDLALDFTITEELFGRRTVVELISGGVNIPVTNENKLQYIYAIADYKLNRQMQPLINAFSRGLSDIISLSWLTLFNARELNQLISGGEQDFDIDDLKANTKYTGGFTENSRTIKQFWEVLREFQPQERCALLKFVTSCPRAPLLGFKHLQPAFTVHKVNCDTTLWSMLGGQDVDRLPSASTCYNTLKLPSYKRLSTLRNKLRYAIHSNAGFELS